MPTQVHIDKFDFHIENQKKAEAFRNAIGVPKGRGVFVKWPLFINVAFDFGPDVPSDDDDCIRLNLNAWKMQGKFINQLNPHAVDDYLKLVDVNKPQDKPTKVGKLKAKIVKVVEAKDEVQEVKADIQEEFEKVNEEYHRTFFLLSLYPLQKLCAYNYPHYHPDYE